MCISTLVYYMPPHAICKPLKCDAKSRSNGTAVVCYIVRANPGARRLGRSADGTAGRDNHCHLGWAMMCNTM